MHTERVINMYKCNVIRAPHMMTMSLNTMLVHLYHILLSRRQDDFLYMLPHRCTEVMEQAELYKMSHVESTSRKNNHDISRVHCIMRLTQSDRDKMPAILQTTLSIAIFLNRNK